MQGFDPGGFHSVFKSNDVHKADTILKEVQAQQLAFASSSEVFQRTISK
jgi:hypothetical protein